MTVGGPPSPGWVAAIWSPSFEAYTKLMEVVRTSKPGPATVGGPPSPGWVAALWSLSLEANT